MSLLKLYNPHEMAADLVTGVATGRESLLARIRAVAHANRDARHIQHLLLSAPRGFGKSFLLRLVQIELGKDAIAMALLPEEQPNVTEPDALLREIRRTWLGEPPGTVKVSWGKPDEDAWDEAVVALDAALDEKFGAGKGFLVVGLENVDLLLRDVFADAAAVSRLRQWLTRADGRIMLLAASATGEVDKDYGKRLFQAFDPLVIEPWTEAKCLTFFERQRATLGKPPMDNAAIAKAKAIALFIGGTPRLATLLGEALLENDSLRAAEVLDKIVDELTPYYKHRIETLNPRAKKLLDALLRDGEPCSQTALAQRVGAPSQAAIAAPFATLQAEQIVIGASALGSRETLYKIQDRVFAHYYRKRFLLHGRDVSPLEAIVDFLETYLTVDEKRDEAGRLFDLGHPREARVLADLAMRDVPRSWERSRDTDAAPERLAETARQFGLHEVAPLKNAIAALRDHADRAATIARQHLIGADDAVLRAFGRAIEARAAFAMRLDAQGCKRLDEAVASLTPDSPVAARFVLLREQFYSDGTLERHDLGVTVGLAFRELVTPALPVWAAAVCFRSAAWSLGQLSRHEDAIATAREAATLAARAGDIREQAESLGYAAWNLGHLSRHEEAVATAREAATLVARAGDIREQAEILGHAAWNLGRLGRHEEAVATAREAATLAAQGGDIRGQAVSQRYAAWSLAQLGHHEEATTMAAASLKAALRIGDERSRAESLELLATDAASLGADGVLIDAVMAWSGCTTSVIADSVQVVAIHFNDLVLAGVRTSRSKDVAAIVGALGDNWADHVRPYQFDAVGLRIVDWAQAEGRAVAYAGIADFVRAFGPAAIGEARGKDDPDHVPLRERTLRHVLDGLATRHADPSLLRDVAALVRDEVGDLFAHSVGMLETAATFHAGGRAPESLARADPDMASAIRRAWEGATPATSAPGPKKGRGKRAG